MQLVLCRHQFLYEPAPRKITIKHQTNLVRGCAMVREQLLNLVFFASCARPLLSPCFPPATAAKPLYTFAVIHLSGFFVTLKRGHVVDHVFGCLTVLLTALFILLF